MIRRSVFQWLCVVAASLVIGSAAGCDMGTYEQRYQQRASELQNTPVQKPAP